MDDNGDGTTPRANNVVSLPLMPKKGSPAGEAAAAQEEKEMHSEAKASVISFLEAHLEYAKSGKFNAIGCFTIMWGEDQSYIINDAGMFPLATMLGLMDLSMHDFRMRHIMSNMEQQNGG